MKALNRSWSNDLSSLFRNAKSEITISSPYISDIGVDLLVNSVTSDFKERGLLKFVTDLSPKNIYQGSTNPFSFEKLFDTINLVQVFHLPKLHAKVYIRDNKQAIITSGNLTAGGLYNNFEYGVCSDNKDFVVAVKNDLTDYGNLGALINKYDIVNYCNLSSKVREKYLKKEQTLSSSDNFRELCESANDELIKLKIKDGKIHPIFEKTIVYILKKYGDLEQSIISEYIKDIQSDLCDDNTDRIINGVNFGKKWKHIARTSMQNLKKRGEVELINGKWHYNNS